MNTEMRVGLFVIIGLAILVYFMIQMGEWNLFGDGGSTYTVVSRFSNVVGLKPGADVVLSGVKIGSVRDLRLDNQRALVILEIFDSVDFPANSEARIASVGLLGQAIVEVVPREPSGGRTARQVGEIGSLEPVTVDQLVAVISNIGDDVTEVTRSVRDFLGVEGGQEAMRETMQNLLDFSADLKSIVEGNRERFDNVMASVELLSEDILARLPTILENVETLSAELKQLMEERSGDLSDSMVTARRVIERLDRAAETLQQILDKINTGDGSISRLLNEPDTAEKTNEVLQRADTILADVQQMMSAPSSLSLSYGMRSNYYLRSGDFKNYFRLSLNFSKTDSVSFELVNDMTRNSPPVFLPGDAPAGGALRLSDEFTASITYGKRFSGGRISFGLIESHTGVAVDLGEEEDLLRFTFEGYDFGRDDGPHLRAASHLRIWEGLFLTVGWDDIVDTDRGQLFCGGGYYF